jgi:hypothetical protein
MNELTARTLVRCPVSEAAARLVEAFRERRASNGKVLPLTFELTLPRRDALDRIRVPYSLNVSVAPTQRERDLPWRYEFGWSTRDGGTPHAFAGCLCVEPHDDYNAFYLRLTGDALGSPVSIEPSCVERKYAKEVIVSVLVVIAQDIERRFRDNERLKLALAEQGLRVSPI